jgi:hypothetical protein
MPARPSSLQQVKSVSQRALASYWDRLAAGRHFPAFTEFAPEPGLHDPKQLVAWNVEGERGQVKFRALYQGENVADVFSSAWAGKTMDQVVPMSLRRVTIGAAKECVQSGRAIYTIVSTIDATEHRVDCERLLLPFGSDGSKVEQILASLQLTSVPGRVRRKKILNNFQMQADLLLSIKIKSGFTKTSGPATENRRASRRNILRSGRINFAKQSMTCTVRNISATGASIEGANLAQAPDTFTLVLEMESTERICTVAWRKKTRMGVRFG